jgi:transcriptional regulator GlxA family with amidase domain
MRTIGALIFPDFELLDVFGPMEMFGLLPDLYDLHLIGPTVGAIPSKQKIAAHATLSTQDDPEFDILFVPGGMGARSVMADPALLNWINRAAAKAEYVMSVCTGSAILAKADVLDGLRATTNKMAYDWVVSQNDKVHWQPKARWVEDGKVFTSSGVSAGMDMALGAIARMHGTEQANEVAKWAEYTWHSDPDHDPFAVVHGLV